MSRVPDAVAHAADDARLGIFVRRYPGAIGTQVYFGTMAAAFTVFIAYMGAPWPPVTGFSLLAALFLVPALVIRINRAAYLFTHGLVLTGYDGRVRAAGRWDQVAGLHVTERQVFFIFTLTRLRWTELDLGLAGHRVHFKTAHSDDAHAIDLRIADHLRRPER
jgi:hypothetical protein